MSKNTISLLFCLTLSLGFNAFCGNIDINVPGVATEVSILQGDILAQKVDAIVNPANTMIYNAGGLARKIEEAAGAYLPVYIYDMKKLPGGRDILRVGEAIVTPSFDLTERGIKFIVHTVGPDCRKPEQCASREALLKSAYTSALEAAKSNPEIKSMALSALSVGIFGYNKSEAAVQSLDAIKSWLSKNPSRFEKLLIVVDPDNFKAYESVIKRS